MRRAAAGLIAVVALAGCGGATTTVSKKTRLGLDLKGGVQLVYEGPVTRRAKRALEERAALARLAVEAVHADCAPGEVRIEAKGVQARDERCAQPDELGAAIKASCSNGGETKRIGNRVECSASLNQDLRVIRGACPKGLVLVVKAGSFAVCRKEAQGH
jgi:preprotein translocase subunit SecD